MDLFNQPPLTEINHGRENNPESEAIYLANEVRLTRNARIILQCLIEGQVLNGAKCVTGIQTIDGKKAIMSEYRKRFDEIERSGIALNKVVGFNGCKSWSLPESEREKAQRLLDKWNQIKSSVTKN